MNGCCLPSKSSPWYVVQFVVFILFQARVGAAPYRGLIIIIIVLALQFYTFSSRIGPPQGQLF